MTRLGDEMRGRRLNLEEGRDAGLDLGEVDEQHDKAASELGLLAATLDHHVHGGRDGAEHHEARGEVAVLAEVDERVGRRLARAAGPHGREQAEQRRQRAVGARREGAQPVAVPGEPPHDVRRGAAHLQRGSKVGTS